MRCIGRTETQVDNVHLLLDAPAKRCFKNRKRHLQPISEHFYGIEFDLWRFRSENASEGSAVTDLVTEILVLPDRTVIGQSQANSPGNKPNM